MTSLKSRLHERDARAVDDADQGEQGEDVAPRAEAEQVKSPRIEPAGKEHHRHAKAAVSAELHDYAGEQHRRAGWGGGVAARRPGVKGPHAGEHGEAYEDQGEGPHLKMCGKGSVRQKLQVHRLAADHPGGDDSGEHQAASGEGIERQLHCRIFAQGASVAGLGGARGRSPNRDKEVFGDDGDFVKDKEQQQIEAEEDAVDAAD